MSARRRRRDTLYPPDFWDDGAALLLGEVAPWQVPFPAIDRRRVLIVANTSVAWSVPTAEWYCQQRGVPVDNVLPLALGTGRTLTLADSVALQSVILAPVLAAMSAVSAVAVLVGPGCPMYVTLAATGGTGTDLQALVCQARLYAGAELALYPGTDAGLYVPGFVADGYGSEVGSLGQALFGITYQHRQPGEPDAWFAVRLPGHVNVLRLALPRAGALLGTLPHPRVIGGRVGAGTRWSGYALETEAAARAIIDSGTRSMWRSGAQARALPHLMHIGSMTDYGPQGWAYAWSVLRDWGLNVRYLHRTADAAALAIAPAGGPGDCGYTAAQVGAGAAGLDPIFCALGVAANGEIIGAQAAQFRAAWPKLDGGLSLVGPSEGSYYAHADQARGVPGGFGSGDHPSALAGAATFAAFLHLLQGLSVAEAVFYAGGGYRLFMAGGDPLQVPYRLD